MISRTMSDEQQASSSWPTRYHVAVAAIVVVAVLFRFFGLNWDQGHYFHPDERFIATVMDNRLSVPAPSELGSIFDPENSPLNTRSHGEDGTPRDFAYGSLPVLIATVLGTFISGPLDIDLTAYEHVGLFGRFLTALIDLGTILIVMLFARRAFGDLAAIIAGALAASSVILIQLAHFFTVDAWVTFFTTASLFASYQVSRTMRPGWTLAVGALGGAALATKVSAGVLAIPILTGLIIGGLTVSSNRRSAVGTIVKHIGLAAIPTIIVFAVFEPYAIWQPGVYFDDIRYQWEIVNARVDVPYTRQFVGTTPGLTEIRDLVLWGVAPGFGIAALAATAVGGYFAFRMRDPRYVLILSWILPYFFVIASSEARFLRYSAPLVPPLAIMVGHQLALWWQSRPAGAPLRRRLGPAIAIVLVVGVTAGWAITFMSVYAGQHPRIEASEWIYEHVESGATLTSEVWDDTLPVRLDTGQTPPTYQRIEMDLYADRPPEEAFVDIAGVLHQADYIVLASQRLSHSIPQLPWRYPVQSAYYRLLHDEELGFELAHHATNFPGFGSLRINTLSADESFSVYDHTPVWIFRKVDNLTQRELRQQFEYALNQQWVPTRETANPTLMLNAPVDHQPVASDTGWSTPLTDFGVMAVIVWLLCIVGLGAIALPAALWLFPRFSDAGIGFAPLLGLLGTGIFTWLAWSLDVAGFTVWTIVASVGALALINWALIGLPADWRSILAGRRTTMLFSLAIFLGIFGLFTLIRSANPDLWHPVYGGERPMETAYINAIARSESFPPYDPWFSDGYLNYYYYGFFLFALLSKLTGIPIDAAFQLMLATLAGLLAAGAYSLGGTLTGSIVQTRRRLWLISGGLLSTFLVVIAGNLDPIVQIVQTRSLEVNFWESSRVVDFGITEFPYFSFIYGDLHPHLIAAPMLVLVVAMIGSWVQLSGPSGPGWLAIWIVTTTVVFGSITVTNLWDGPTAAVILTAGLLMPTLRRTRTPWNRVARAASLIPLIGIGSWLLFYKFHASYVAQTDGLEFTETGTAVSEWFVHFGGLVLVLIAVFLLAFARLLNTNPFGSQFMLVGVMLATIGYLAGSIIGWGLHDNAWIYLLTGVAAAAAGGVVAQAPAGIRTRRDRIIALLLIAPFIVGMGILVWERPVGAIGTAMVAAFLTLYMTNQQRDGVLVGSIAGAAGAGLIATTEVIYVADHLQNSDWERMNTIFKLYFQSWTLLSIASAGTVMWLLYQARKRITARPTSDVVRNAVTIVGAWAIHLIGPLLVIAMLAYPVLATPERVSQDMASSPSDLTLDGYEWMDGGMIQNPAGDVISFTGDLKAIEWLQENVDGNPVILEAEIGPYIGAGSRISAATGMPTVVGWATHQDQQRGTYEVRQRSIDVREIYDSSSVQRKWQLLKRYRIDYIVVGDVERYTLTSEIEAGRELDNYASEEGLETLEEMEGEGLEVVFEADGTIIYRVNDFRDAGQAT